MGGSLDILPCLKAGYRAVMDTGKRHGDGTMIQQVKWSDGVLPLIQQAA